MAGMRYTYRKPYYFVRRDVPVIRLMVAEEHYPGGVFILSEGGSINATMMERLVRQGKAELVRSEVNARQLMGCDMTREAGERA
jgi:hypothetical protein